MEFLQYECLSQLNWRILDVPNVCILCFRNITEFYSEERLRAAVEIEHSVVTSPLTEFALPQQCSYVECCIFADLLLCFALHLFLVYFPVVSRCTIIL